MCEADTSDSEEKSLRALVVMAYRDESAAIESTDGEDAVLSLEDKAALEALGPDLVARIVRGDANSGGHVPPLSCESGSVEFELAAAMNRASNDPTLTDKARNEIERKIAECDEEDGDRTP